MSALHFFHLVTLIYKEGGAVLKQMQFIRIFVPLQNGTLKQSKLHGLIFLPVSSAIQKVECHSFTFIFMLQWSWRVCVIIHTNYFALLLITWGDVPLTNDPFYARIKDVIKFTLHKDGWMDVWTTVLPIIALCKTALKKHIIMIHMWVAEEKLN